MKIISKYIRRSVIQAVLLCLLILTGLQCFIELINVTSDLGKNGFSIGAAILYVIMKLPADLYQMFPMVGFIGCLLGLGRLSSNSELIVIRAAGVSISRIALSVVMAASILMFFVTVVGECVAPSLVQAAQYIKHPDQRHAASQLHDVWLHQGNTFLNIGKVRSDHQVESLYRFNFDKDQHLVAYWHAQSAIKSNDQWTLKHVEITRVNQLPHKQYYASYPLNMTFQPEMLVDNHIDLRNQSAIFLWNKFHYLKHVGLDQGQTTFTLWQHLMQPLTTIVMICLGVPFTLGSLRDSSAGARSVVGVLIGFGFYMLNEFLGPMAFIYHVPPQLAATLPSILFFSLYMIMLRRLDR